MSPFSVDDPRTALTVQLQGLSEALRIAPGAPSVFPAKLFGNPASFLLFDGSVATSVGWSSTRRQLTLTLSRASNCPCGIPLGKLPFGLRHTWRTCGS